MEEKENFKLDSFIFHYVYVVVFISIYVLSNNQLDSIYLYTKVFNLITTLIILFFLLAKIIMANPMPKIKLNDLILFQIIINIVFLTILIRKYINFHWIYLFFAYFYFYKKNIELNQIFRRLVLTIVFFSVIYQLLTTRFMGIRPVINWYDPNYSGFFLFLLFLFLKYENMKIMSIIIFITGFFTLSRSYVLATLVYILINNTSFIKSLIIKIKLNNFFIVMIISLLVLSFIEISFINIDRRLEATQNNIEKMYKLADASNQDRFTANVIFKKELFDNFFDYQFGVDQDWYIKNVFINTPHNSFYALIVNYGVYFTFFYIMIFGRIYNKFFIKQNIAIIMSIFTYYIFLGGGLQGYPSILIFYLLSLKK